MYLGHRNSSISYLSRNPLSNYNDFLMFFLVHTFFGRCLFIYVFRSLHTIFILSQNTRRSEKSQFRVNAKFSIRMESRQHQAISKVKYLISICPKALCVYVYSNSSEKQYNVAYYFCLNIFNEFFFQL